MADPSTNNEWQEAVDAAPSTIPTPPPDRYGEGVEDDLTVMATNDDYEKAAQVIQNWIDADMVGARVESFPYLLQFIAASLRRPMNAQSEVQVIYEQMERQQKDAPVYDLATLKAVHDFFEFEATDDLTMDAFLHAHIKKAIAAVKEGE